jgi:tetratricopeptide (TPR) repeat protein
MGHDSFSSWLCEKQYGTLWVEGPPGKMTASREYYRIVLTNAMLIGRGKSVMAAHVCQHLEETGHNPIFYQFYRSGSLSRSTPTTATASILYQLLSRLNGIGSLENKTALEKLMYQFPLGPLYCPFTKIWSITESILESQSGTIIILDALDECANDEDSTPEVLEFYGLLRSVMDETRGKIIVFTRPNLNFLSSANASAFRIFLSEDILLPDVLKFAGAEYAKLHLPVTERLLVLQHIRRSCQGSFWWTKLYLGYLHQATNKDEFRQRLSGQRIPSVNDIYLQTLRQSCGRRETTVLNCQRAILALILDSQRLLTASELGDALLLWPDGAEHTISRLGNPLIFTHQDFVQFTHPSARDFAEAYRDAREQSLGYTIPNPHNLMTETCLRHLLREDYANPSAIATQLMDSHDPAKFKGHALAPPQKHQDFYNYASKYWHIHLSLTRDPSDETLLLVDRFLTSLQITHWCEHTTQAFGFHIGVLGAINHIKAWLSGLSGDRKLLLDIDVDSCLTSSYEKLITTFERSKEASAPISQALARITLGTLYSHKGLVKEQVALRKLIIPALVDYFGANHSLVLRHQGFVAFSQMLCGRMRAAHHMYARVAESQHALVGEDNIAFVEALHYRGESEYLMADFTMALLTFTKALAGFLAITGHTSWSHLAASLWYGRSLAQLGEVEKALSLWQDAFQKRAGEHGDDDEFATIMRVGMADLLRSLGRHDEAISQLRICLSRWRKSKRATDKSRLDAEIMLARTLQESGMNQQAMSLVKELEQLGCQASHFERYCQVVHIKGLVLSAADDGLNDAIHALGKILICVEPDQNNRALLWIRLDLANMLRRRGSDGDEELAHAVFDGVVKDWSGNHAPGFPDEPDSAHLLKVAEEALALLRCHKHSSVRALLENRQVRWARESDLWLWRTDAVFI